jgi:hypothetical protein
MMREERGREGKEGREAVGKKPIAGRRHNKTKQLRHQRKHQTIRVATDQPAEVPAPDIGYEQEAHHPISVRTSQEQTHIFALEAQETTRKEQRRLYQKHDRKTAVPNHDRCPKPLPLSQNIMMTLSTSLLVR